MKEYKVKQYKTE